jgi:hypothetical protein
MSEWILQVGGAERALGQLANDTSGGRRRFSGAIVVG